MFTEWTAPFVLDWNPNLADISLHRDLKSHPFFQSSPEAAAVYYKEPGVQMKILDLTLSSCICILEKKINRV